MIKKSYIKAGHFKSPTDFYKFPKFLNSITELTSDAKIAYMLICDRMSLSELNEWKDEDGFLYCYFTLNELCEELKISESTARRTMKLLIKHNLIDNKRQGVNKPNLIYLLDIEDVKSADRTRKSEQSGPVNLNGPDPSNLRSSITNNNKTNRREASELRSEGARPPHPLKAKRLFDTNELEHTSRVNLLEEKLSALNKNKFPAKAAEIKFELAELTCDYSNLTGRDFAYRYKNLYLDYYGKPLEDFSIYFSGTMNNILKTYVKSPELMPKVLDRMLVQYEYRREKDKYPTLNCETLGKAWLMKKFIPNVLSDIEREMRKGGEQVIDEYSAIISEKVKNLNADVDYF